MNDLRYPIGPWQRRDTLTSSERAKCIDIIEATPAKLRKAVAGLSQKQLETPYRDGGWTLRQVAHHVPDSHLNAYLRTKFALTENDPRILSYDENAWANLGDVKVTPIETSLVLLEAIHGRWVALLRSLKAEQFARTLQHPENGRMTIDTLVDDYAWHGPHHTAHITSARARLGF